LLRYYRPNDVPELSFSLVTQARIEGKNNKYFQVCKLENFNLSSLFSSLFMTKFLNLNKIKIKLVFTSLNIIKTSF